MVDRRLTILAAVRTLQARHVTKPIFRDFSFSSSFQLFFIRNRLLEKKNSVALLLPERCIHRGLQIKSRVAGFPHFSTWCQGTLAERDMTNDASNSLSLSLHPPAVQQHGDSSCQQQQQGTIHPAKESRHSSAEAIHNQVIQFLPPGPSLSLQVFSPEELSSVICAHRYNFRVIPMRLIYPVQGKGNKKINK